MAARPRTLPAAIAPVLVGTALAVTETDLRVGGFVAALLGAIFIQVGTQLSNDYYHPRRGGEPGERLRPARLHRLLRRAPGCRHRGAARAGARPRGRPRPAAPGARGDVRQLRARRR